MTNTITITLNSTGITELLRTHFNARGYNTDAMDYRMALSGSIEVVGLEKVPGVVDHASQDDEVIENAKIRDAVLEEIYHEPHAVGAIAALLEGVTWGQVNAALDQLGDQVATVCAAREDGETVSAWMKTGTPQCQEFVEAEAARIDALVEEHKDAVLAAAPKFYARFVAREDILYRLCEGRPEEEQETLRRDCRSVFYRMAALSILQHQGHGWRAYKTDTHIADLVSLQGAVREVLHQDRAEAEIGLTRNAIAEKLPGVVEDKLLQHAVQGMDDVYECGLGEVVKLRHEDED